MNNRKDIKIHILLFFSFANRQVQTKTRLIKARMKASLVSATSNQHPQYLFLLLPRWAPSASIFLLFLTQLLHLLSSQCGVAKDISLLPLNSPRLQTRTVTRNPRMWSRKWRSWSITSTFLQTRRRRNLHRPWTRPTPVSSSSSSSFCSCRFSASRNTHMHRLSPSSIPRCRRRRFRLSKSNRRSATSRTITTRPTSESHQRANWDDDSHKIYLSASICYHTSALCWMFQEKELRYSLC